MKEGLNVDAEIACGLACRTAGGFSEQNRLNGDWKFGGLSRQISRG